MALDIFFKLLMCLALNLVSTNIVDNTSLMMATLVANLSFFLYNCFISISFEIDLTISLIKKKLVSTLLA